LVMTNASNVCRMLVREFLAWYDLVLTPAPATPPSVYTSGGTTEQLPPVLFDMSAFDFESMRCK
jgi:hypothetical protein